MPTDEPEAVLGAARGADGLARRADGQCIDVRNTDVAAVEAVGLVHFGQPRIVGLDKGNVDALMDSG